ncbi:YrdB family protein [Actinomadura barringtoniae]|uniref:YrdB family protein n=1 Tax=Actinomadura barringtoniae TaxID=1427535 RepID=A0A939P637_9ACTN|nr:YrdB family protein [Actinomadura barringtoniae]MBO2445785.1 YrdB family protein [Actinomadura barringtoniae]
MSVVDPLNATVAFLLELAVYAAVGYWGFTKVARLPFRLAAAAGAVALMAVIWGLFGAPSATYPLHGPARAVLELAWFGVGAAAWLNARGRRAAFLFAGGWVVSTSLALIAMH